jgi:hypothetical protein
MLSNACTPLGQINGATGTAVGIAIDPTFKYTFPHKIMTITNTLPLADFFEIDDLYVMCTKPPRRFRLWVSRPGRFCNAWHERSHLVEHHWLCFSYTENFRPYVAYFYCSIDWDKVCEPRTIIANMRSCPGVIYLAFLEESLNKIVIINPFQSIRGVYQFCVLNCRGRWDGSATPLILYRHIQQKASTSRHDTTFDLCLHILTPDFGIHFIIFPHPIYSGLWFLLRYRSAHVGN